MMSVYHEAVMMKESIMGLAIKPEGTYVDVTFGGGGHAREILKKLGDNGRLIAFDQDGDAQENLPADSRLIFVPQNFRYLKRYLRLYGIQQIDGLLADLGVSSHQFDEADRGFSFRFEANLDMRMDQSGQKTAADILNGYTQKELQGLFSKYGEVRNAKTLAERVVVARQVKKMHTTRDLLNAVAPVIRGQKHKYLAQVFQALRIELNGEMEALEDMLLQSAEVLKPGGRLVVISYHSLEDRTVKNFLKSGDVEGEVIKDFYGKIFRPFKVLTKKAVLPSAAELQVNNRARSAKLRIGERTADQLQDFLESGE